MKFIKLNGKMFFISEIESHSDIFFRVKEKAQTAGFVQKIYDKNSFKFHLYGKSTTLKLECDSENDNALVSSKMKFTKEEPVRFFIFHGQYPIFTSEKDDLSLIGEQYESGDVVTGLIHIETEENTDIYSDSTYSPVFMFTELSRELDEEELSTLKYNLRS